MKYRILMSLVFVLPLMGSACARVPPADPGQVRVLIRFQQPTPGGDADVVARLSKISGAEVRFAAAVSEQEYAYTLVCPSPDPGCQQAVTALRAWGQIEWINPDAIKRIQR
jgi:hypothetical protein